MRITKGSVVAFKEIYCDENRLIASSLREQVAEDLPDPLLDVGAGMGDISAAAFPDRRVVLLDILDYSNHPTPQRHERKRSGFFDYDPDGIKFGTIFLCHVLQFIDDSVERLNAKLLTLGAEKVVVVANRNDDFMGELISWFAKNVRQSNPELALLGFPAGYSPEQQIRFEAQVDCPDYDRLVQQIAFLMDSNLTSQERNLLKRYTSRVLAKPAFSIGEQITVYQRNSL
jgi:hypothetical protein